MTSFPGWIAENHPKFQSLTDSVVLITKSLLKDADISYLTVTGRTKSENDCIEKIKRKGYRNPVDQLTDISGIRIVVYFDYDVRAVCKLIEQNFSIDGANSSNRDELLSTDQVGYRSVHYVCDLGPDRIRLHEHRALKGLKFEFQVRTVLQHAWAELAHDRNYKFAGQLPKNIKRKLYLLAANMESADEGFSSLSREIDRYVADISEQADIGKLEIDINSISIEKFVRHWAEKSGFRLEELRNRSDLSDLLDEVSKFGLETLSDLDRIIPKDFAKTFGSRATTIFGVVRDWMVISDPEKMIHRVQPDWPITDKDLSVYEHYLSSERIAALRRYFTVDFEGETSPDLI